jgi:hypothetical protein
MPAAADILSDPIINQAYEDVRSDKSDTTWMVLKVRHSPLCIVSLAVRASGILCAKTNASMRPRRLTT